MNIYLKLISMFGDSLYFIFYAIICIIAGYYFIISIFGWKKRTEKCDYNGPLNSYAIIISAHNEETVIKDTINKIQEMEYPSNKYEIFVVADNCTDRTAQFARECGVSVHERTNISARGKGQALKWMFNILFHMDKKYDAAVILDADNHVSKDFLKHIDKKMSEGFKVVQGYRDMKNPWETWITLSYAITYWLANRLTQLPRHYLGMNCTLTGSGYAVSFDVLRNIGWEVETLTEDVEFYFQLCLQDVKIGWAHEAVIYDEQPTTLLQSWKQRTRWMQGHFSCVYIYGKQIFKKLIEEKSIQAFDSLIILLYPFACIIGFLLMAIQGIYTIVQSEDASIRTIVLIALISVISFLAQNGYSLSVLADEKKANKRVILGLIILPVFNFTWIPIMIHGFFTRKNKEWAHIVHSGSMTL